ncbi:armadillo-type protein [Zychaea mexicana]|uniref:armadillo-type protein n=1 Tax=Zychaea mexicana TaxID=64656 RepID=UPI0022FE2105|nr:armadillo-type protein [Zychaea mexicana]KAI9488527.1 armadillo-type protein [Zychaea mexicana]
MSRPSVETLDFFGPILSIRNELQSNQANPPTREVSRTVTLQLNQLRDTLITTPNVETICDKRLINFILTTLMPVLQWIKQADSSYNNVVEAWLRCILVFLYKTYWTASSPPQLLEQLMILFTNYLMDASKSGEEIRHLAVQCIATCLSVIKDKIELYQALRDIKFRPQMAGCITALLDVIRCGDALQLRIDAMHALSTLTLDALGEIDIVAVFLPGITSALGRTIYQKQEKENQQILSTAFDVLGNVIVFVMQDEHAPDSVVPNIQSLHDLTKHIKGKQHVDKTQDFVENFYATSKSKIKGQLDFILDIRSYNTDWRVRRAMVRFAGQLLTKCSRTLDNCTSLLLKTIVLHFDDEYLQVKSEAQLQIRDIMQVPSFGQTIIPILKENLAVSVTYIPSTLISGDEGDKVTAMALITGYVLILGNRHAQGVLDSTITKTLDAWLAAFKIDQDGINVLEEKGQNSTKLIEFQGDGKGNINDNGGDDDTWPDRPSLVYPKIRFKYLAADRTATQAGRMLNVIGRHGSLSYWLDLLMDSFREQELDVQPQAAYMIHSLLSGASATESDTDSAQWLARAGSAEDREEASNIKATALRILHEIINLVIDPTTNSRTNVVRGERQYHKLKKELETAEVLATCFGLQIVGLVACIVEAEYVQDELITLLYPLLAHLGSPNVFIHTYALITLDAIALVCGQRGAQQLAVENIDHIINMVSQRISVLEDNLRAPLVLKALIRIGGPGTINYLEDTVEEVFDALEGYHMDDWSCAQLCSVLTEIVRVVYRKNVALLESDKDASVDNREQQRQPKVPQLSSEIRDLIESNTSTDDVSTETATMGEIGQYFLDRQKKNEKTPSMDPNDLLPDDENGGPTRPPDDTPEPLSRAQQMTLSIMTQGRHFLTASSPQLRVEMLGLFAAGTKVLAHRLDKVGVLVNQTWTHIIQRLSDDDNMVVLQAVTVIGSIAESLNDFISNRVKDFWPKFKELLKQGRSESYHYSIFSYVHRLHNAILLALKSVAEHALVEATMIPEMMDEIKWYLDERLHVELQQSAIKVFGAMSKRYPDTVWVYMMSMLSSDESTLVDETGFFKPFAIPEWMSVKETYYRRNARQILAIVPAY